MTDFIKDIKDTRLRLGMSQRQLSELTGIPQAQISRIEGGLVDLRVSSLMAIAHALDMDAVLVPRKAVNAVQAITKQNTPKKPYTVPDDIIWRLNNTKDNPSRGSYLRLTKQLGFKTPAYTLDDDHE